MVSLMCLVLQSCTEDILKPKIKPTDGINILIGNHYLIESGNISYYDLSSHQFYLNNSVRSQLDNIKCTKYWILNDGEVIFEGMFNNHSLCCNLYADSLLVLADKDMATFTLKLVRPQCWFINSPQLPDLRNEQQFVEVLKQKGKLKYGISTRIERVLQKSDSVLNIHFSVTNNDDLNYYILNPNILTGNGLYDDAWQIVFYDKSINNFWRSIHENSSIYCYNSQYDINQLMLLKAGETFSYQKEYSFKRAFSPGSYLIYHKYPGLGVEFKNDIEETILDDGRIWLGNNERISEVEIVE